MQAASHGPGEQGKAVHSVERPSVVGEDERGATMEQMVFHYDSVLSDVHMLRPNRRHLMTRLNHVGQPVFVSKFQIFSEGVKHDRHHTAPTEGGAGGGERDEGGGGGEAAVDEDGDLAIARRPRTGGAEDGGGRAVCCPIILKQSDHAAESHQQDEDQEEEEEEDSSIIRIEHTMATPLEDVGKQVWRGAFLLADYILSQPLLFGGATVLELGAGTGLTSVVMATLAKRVYCTDVGEDLLSMCRNNVALNRRLMAPAGGEVRVRQLDWLQDDLCTDAAVDFSWTEEEVADLHDNTSVILAADICYDDQLTDALFRTLYRLCSHFAHSVTIFISVEKRMNFSLRHLDVCCEAYDHFRRCLSQLQELRDAGCGFRVQRLPTLFPQALEYERIQQLELWKVTTRQASPVPPGPGPAAAAATAATAAT